MHCKFITSYYCQEKGCVSRLCCDFWQMNNKTIHDHHPLPIIQNIIVNLHRNKYFNLLHQCKAYHQFKIAPKHFIPPWRFYERAQVPFGLRNALVCFQRFMEHCLEEGLCDTLLGWPSCVLSLIWRPHQPPRQLLQSLRKYNMTKEPSRCQLFKKEVSYLDRLNSNEPMKGIHLTLEIY